MDREDVRDRLDVLEDKLRWQKRAIAGLLVIFLFSASPALTQATKWFNRVLPSKLASFSLRHGTTPGDVRFGGSFARPRRPSVTGDPGRWTEQDRSGTNHRCR